jgi:hypothetical protein
VTSRLTRLETEILYTLWVSEVKNRKNEGLLYTEVFEETNKRYACTFDSVKKRLQSLGNRREPYPPVADSKVPEDSKTGRRRNLWLLEKHLVTMPESAVIAEIAHESPQSCILATDLQQDANKAGITDEVFKERMQFLIDNEYLSKRYTWTLFYTREDRILAEIDYLRKIAEHFQRV